MNLADINGEHISRANFGRDKAFESFVRELLYHEVRVRHARSTELIGPVAAYHRDGQRDLVVRVVEPPRVSLAESPRDTLTWDELGEVWYSCKGGSTWQKSIESELGRSAFSAYKKDPKPPGPRAKRPSTPLLTHLSEGGRYVFVISEQQGDRHPWLEKIAKLLRFWLEQVTLPVPPGLDKQLEFFDANKLADFIRAHRPTLSTQVLDALGAQEPGALMSFEEWGRHMTPQRTPPEFEPDPLREELLRVLGDRTRPIIRIHGAPGVGKTRLVHEALSRHPEQAHRVRYSDEPLQLLDELRPWLRRSQGLTLVIDELRSVDVGGFVRHFRVSAKDSQLILIGTSDAEADRGYDGGVETYELRALSDESTRALIAREFELAEQSPAPHAETILRLSEGYPLFALKLAEALAKDGDALARGTDESNYWDAASRVLLGPRADVHDWEAELERRGRCLLVVLLTRELELEWDELWERYGEALGRALDHDADELRRARKPCVERGLLREVGARHRYVSPANLARILLNHYIGGGDDLGPRIVRHTPDLASSVLQVAAQLRAQPRVIERLTEAYWAQLREARDRRDMGAIGRWVGGPAEYDPQGAARAHAELVESMADELSTWQREQTLSTLAHATRRRLDAQLFARAERAMCQLVQALGPDDPAWARERWVALFFIGLSPTHQPWSLRLELLRAHARAPAPAERRAVAQAMHTLLGDQTRGPVSFPPDRLDGEWPAITVQELWEGHRDTWALAIELSMDDDAEVAALARKALAERFGEEGLRPPTVAALTEVVANWLPQQRQPLREGVARVLHFEAEPLAEHPEFVAALEQLLATLEPVDLTSRVIARMSTERPDPWWSAVRDTATIDAAQERTEALDRELAERLCAAPQESVDAVLSWMSSPEARRVWPFATALGESDTEHRLLAQIERIADEHEQLLVGYIAGWARRDPSETDTWLREHLDSPLSAAVVRILADSSPSDERLELLETIVGRYELDAIDMRPFAARRWILSFAPDRALTLLESMVARALAPTSTLEMGLQLLEQTLTDEQRARSLKILEAALLASSERRVPTVAQLAWVRAACMLLEHERSEVVAEALLRLLDVHRGNLGLAERTLSELLSRGHGPRLWRDMREPLSAPNMLGHAIHLANVGMLRRLDADALLAWVGAEHARALLVARMTTPYSEQLDPIIEGLLRRFGANGAVARQLRERALRSPLAAPPLEFERRQRDHVRAWLEQTEIRAVQGWAEGLLSTLELDIDAQELRAGLRKRYA